MHTLTVKSPPTQRERCPLLLNIRLRASKQLLTGACYPQVECTFPAAAARAVQHIYTTTMSANLYEILGVQADATPEQSMLPIFCRHFSFSQAYPQFERLTRNVHSRHIPIVLQPRTRPRQRRSFVRRAPSQFYMMVRQLNCIRSTTLMRS